MEDCATNRDNYLLQQDKDPMTWKGGREKHSVYVECVSAKSPVP